MKKIIILITLFLFVCALNSGTVYAIGAKKPGGGGSNPPSSPPPPPPPSKPPDQNPPAKSGPAPDKPPDTSPSSSPDSQNDPGINPNTNTNSDTPNNIKINWQGDSISAAIKIASKELKVIFIYFYFDQVKEQFPSNFDPRLQAYSVDRYVFTKIFVVTFLDKDNKLCIADQTTAAFFQKNKLPLAAVGVVLDPYGNMLDKIAPPLGGPKMIPFLDAAEKKFHNTESNLSARYDKADQLLAGTDLPSAKDKDKHISDAIKILTEIAKSPLVGYDVIKKASARLDELNDKAVKEYMDILKEYAAEDKDSRDPKEITPKLEKVMKTYAGLPVEKELKDAIKDVKVGKIPDKVLKEMEQEKHNKNPEPKK